MIKDYWALSIFLSSDYLLTNTIFRIIEVRSNGRPVYNDNQFGPTNIVRSSTMIVSPRKNMHYKILNSFIRLIINSKMAKIKKKSIQK